MIKLIARSQSGAMLIELVLILVGAVMPVLVAATSLAQVLEAQSRLDLITREASRGYALAANHQQGMAQMLVLQQQPVLNSPISLTLTCASTCEAGDSYQVSGLVRLELFSVPFLSDITISLSSKVKASLDKYLER